jgi:putative Holliday junction resolvase
LFEADRGYVSIRFAFDEVAIVMNGRIVGVDFGARRTGIAIADPLGLFAQVLGTFSPEEALNELRRLDEEMGVALVVLGWPLAPDGTEGEAVARTAAFERRIAKAIPGARIERMDERYSSQEAGELMREAGVPKRRRSRKGQIDAASAAVILQSYLDANPVK